MNKIDSTVRKHELTMTKNEFTMTKNETTMTKMYLIVTKIEWITDHLGLNSLLSSFFFLNIHRVLYCNCPVVVSLCTPFDSFSLLLYYTVFFFPYHNIFYEDW